MKLLDIVVAYKTTEALAGNTEFTPAEQWIIYKFRQAAKPHVEFYQEREQSLKDKYAEFADKEGNLSKDKSNEYVSELNEFLKLDVDFNYTKEQLSIVKGVDFTIIERLDKFFEFIVQ